MFYVLKNVSLSLKYLLKSVVILPKHLLKNVIVRMERIVFQKLIEWKDSTNRKPLILNGARQVGKTWLLEQLGDRYFDKVAYLVCRKNQALKDVFSQDFDTDRILRALRALSGVDITQEILSSFSMRYKTFLKLSNL